MSDSEIRDQPDQSRFATAVEGHEAVLEYRIEGSRIRLHHTRVPEEVEGRGVGSALTRHALETARERDLEVWPDCPFVAAYIQRHPEYLELVDPEYPDRHKLEQE